MFDDLDDPSFAGPGPATRERVAARAARIRRNRQAGWAIGLASVVALVSAVTVGLGERTSGTAPIQPITSVTPTPAESPTPTPTSSPSPSATVRAGGPVSGVSPRTLPTPPPSPEPRTGGRYTRCSRAEGLPDPGTAPDPALTFTIDLPEEVEAGSYDRSIVTITNTSTNVVADLHVIPADRGDRLQTVADDGAGHVSGYRWTTMEEPREQRLDYAHFRLRPGESWQTSVYVVTQECVAAPAGADQNPSIVWTRDLPPGTYQMSVGIDWWGQLWTEEPAASPTDASASPTASPSPEPPPAEARSAEGTWATAPQEVRIV